MRIPIPSIGLALLIAICHTACSQTDTVTQNDHPITWKTSAPSSAANMFTLTDSSTAPALAKYNQPGHALQIVTGSSSFLNPFAVYARTAPSAPGTNDPPNAAFEITNGLDAGRGDTYLLFSNFEYHATPAYTNTPLATQFELNGKWDGPGFNLGNNRTSAGGWSTGSMFRLHMIAATRGIYQLSTAYMEKTAQGDTALSYRKLTAFGGTVASSDEAITADATHTSQRGFVSGTIASGASKGSTLITANTTCTGVCDGAYSGDYFADGGILLDTRKPGITATITDCASPSAQPRGHCAKSDGLSGMYYDISGAEVKPSTAWGNLIPSSCTGNGNGQYQAYVSTTCNVALLSLDAFTTTPHIFLSGPFEEEAEVTAVGTPSGNTQSITFSTRYAWNNKGGNTLVMQGGPGGQSLIATGSTKWPVAYAIVGATSPTRIYFSNCMGGTCNGYQPGNIILPAVKDSFGRCGTLKREDNVVSLDLKNCAAAYNIYSYPPGSLIVIGGTAPGETNWASKSATNFNGTFKISSNTLDSYKPVITWDQTAPNDTATGGSVSGASPQITLYPSAFITGTNNGAIGAAQLATNSIEFAPGDTVIGAPTSEYQQKAHIIYAGQTTPNDGSRVSLGYQMIDTGPSPMVAQYSATTDGTIGLSPTVFDIHGTFNNIFTMYNRPGNNGCILCVTGNDPVLSAPRIPYQIFKDNGKGGAYLTFKPAEGLFLFSGSVQSFGVLTTTGITNTGTTTLGSTGQATIDASGNIATTGNIATRGRIAPQQSTPANSSAACTAGQIWSDASYIYVCTATNTIKRAALSTF